MHEMNGSGNDSRWERADAPLGTLVYRAGLLSKEKLESALQEGHQSGRRLGEILLQKGWLEERDLARLLAGQKGLPFISLRGRGFDPETVRLLPEQVCRYHNAMPVAFEDGTLLVAIADPTDEDAVAEIERELARSFRLAVATTSEIRAALDDVFSAAPPASADEAAPGAPAPLVGETGLRVSAPLAFTGDPATSPAVPAPPWEQPSVVAPAEQRAERPLERPAEQPAEQPTFAPAPAPAPSPAPPAGETPPSLSEPPAPETPSPVGAPPAPTFSFPDSEPSIPRIEEPHVDVAYRAATAPPAADSPASPAASVAPAALSEPAAPPPAPEATARFALVLNLDGGEEIEAESFHRQADADAAAQALAAELARGATWPRAGRWFIRPDRILALEIRESPA
jgi:hypothetical protein